MPFKMYEVPGKGPARPHSIMPVLIDYCYYIIVWDRCVENAIRPLKVQQNLG